MIAPYRIASPPESPRTEEADSYEARLLAGRRRYWAQMALLTATIAAMTILVVRASREYAGGAEKARRQEALRIHEARTTVMQARDQLSRAEKAFDDEVHAALESRLAPTLPLAACPIAIGDAERLVRGESMTPLLVVREGEQTGKVRHYWSPTLEGIRRDVDTADALVNGAEPLSAVVYTDALAARTVDQRAVRDVIIVTSRWQSPVRASSTAYQPGQIDGMAYVFDFSTRTITCAGEVHAQSSRSLSYTYNETHDVRGVRLDKTLDEDLDRQLARAVAEPNVLFAIHGTPTGH